MTYRNQLFIDGEFVDSIDGATLEVLNPHDCSVITNIAEGRANDIDRAVAAAKGLSLASIDIVDLTNLPNLQDYAHTYFELRKAKGITEEQALAQMRKRVPDLVRELPWNPLPDSFQVTAKNADDLGAIAYSFTHPKPPGVQAVIQGKKLRSVVLDAKGQPEADRWIHLPQRRKWIS